MEERNVRLRIAWELKDREWSYNDLVAKLAAAGVPTHTSTVHKILRGEPPRRLNVDEFCAIAEVFGIPPTELMLPMETMLGEIANKHLNMLNHDREALEEALDHFELTVGRMEQLIGGGGHQAALQEWRRDYGQLMSEFERLFLDAAELPYEIDVDADEQLRGSSGPRAINQRSAPDRNK